MASCWVGVVVGFVRGCLVWCSIIMHDIIHTQSVNYSHTHLVGPPPEAPAEVEGREDAAQPVKLGDLYGFCGCRWLCVVVDGCCC